jgi:hypothetical protein
MMAFLTFQSTFYCHFNLGKLFLNKLVGSEWQADNSQDIRIIDHSDPKIVGI